MGGGRLKERKTYTTLKKNVACPKGWCNHIQFLMTVFDLQGHRIFSSMTLLSEQHGSNTRRKIRAACSGFQSSYPETIQFAFRKNLVITSTINHEKQ